jgi:hypothetical protein
MDDMRHELPDEFSRLTPQRAPAELRQRALAAVGKELSARATDSTTTNRHKPLWERAMELATATSLALGVGLHVWHSQHDAVWREQVFGRRSDPTAITATEFVKPVTRTVANATAMEHSEWTSLGQYNQLLRELAAQAASFKL